MQINYEGYAEASNGQRYRILATRHGGFRIPADQVPGAGNDLTGESPEEVQAGLDAWLEAAETQLEYEREQRREYAEEKKERAAKVVNTEAWLVTQHSYYSTPKTGSEFLDRIKVNRVTVRGRKMRSKKGEALITLGGKNTSSPVRDLRLGTAEDMEEYKSLLLASWKAERAAHEAEEPHRYDRLFRRGYSAPDPEFSKRVEEATATYNGDGTWTISGEGIEDFVVPGKSLHMADTMVERRMAAVSHPYTRVDVERRGYSFGKQMVIPTTDYEGYGQPRYVYPDLETAQSVVDLLNQAAEAKDAVQAWDKAHRYTYGWEGQD